MFFIIGPCALESKTQIMPVIELAKRWGIHHIRAQIFKPRTSPHSFQGLGESGIPLLKLLKAENFRLVCEACSLEQLEILAPYADILQIGSRNMQNFELLKGMAPLLARQNLLDQKEFLLKRGFASTLEEWLASAEYLHHSGVRPQQIILCERGSRTACGLAGVTLDFALALEAKRRSPYRMVIDPSHGTKHRHLVLPLTQAAMALDDAFDGVMIEVHPWPEQSLSDAPQALSCEELDAFLSRYEDRLHVT